MFITKRSISRCTVFVDWRTHLLLESPWAFRLFFLFKILTFSFVILLIWMLIWMPCYIGKQKSVPVLLPCEPSPAEHIWRVYLWFSPCGPYWQWGKELTNPKSKSKVQVQTDNWVFIKIGFSNHPGSNSTPLHLLTPRHPASYLSQISEVQSFIKSKIC